MIKGSISLKITSDNDLVVARQRAASFAEALGFSKSSSVIVSTILSQIARFLLRLNNVGRVNIYSIQKGLKNGIVISALSNENNTLNVHTMYDQNLQFYLGNLPLGLQSDLDKLAKKKIIDEFNIVSVNNKGISIEIVKYI